MSMFGRGSNAPTGGVNLERVEMATQQLDMVTDLFNTLVSACHTKCISTRYTEGVLNKGESVCVDRCVAKFFEASTKIGDRIRSVNANEATGAIGL